MRRKKSAPDHRDYPLRIWNGHMEVTVTMRREGSGMSDQFHVFEVVLKQRGRRWLWEVRTTEGRLVMKGLETYRFAASYVANRALFLLLLSAPYRARLSDLAIQAHQDARVRRSS